MYSSNNNNNNVLDNESLDLRQEKEVAIKKVGQTTRGENAHQVK